MKLRKFEDLPKEFQNEKVKSYYQIVCGKRGSLLVKRCFDIILSLLMIVLLSPLLLIIGISIKLDSKGPVFYRQKRITTYGQEFRIFKFRTMVDGADKKGSLVTLEADSRITKVGEKIRKVRLDEIPQLFNILKGEMSFVGTRPEVKKYVDCYSEEMLATLLLPAGVTSLASIYYKDEDKILDKYTREGLSVDDAYVEKILPEKMKYNLDYLRDFSFISDIKIMIKTFFSVLK